jgi:hypothetical protein
MEPLLAPPTPTKLEFELFPIDPPTPAKIEFELFLILNIETPPGTNQRYLRLHHRTD